MIIKTLEIISFKKMLIDFWISSHYFLLSTLLPSLIKEYFYMLYSSDKVNLRS